MALSRALPPSVRGASPKGGGAKGARPVVEESRGKVNVNHQSGPKGGGPVGAMCGKMQITEV